MEGRIVRDAASAARLAHSTTREIAAAAANAVAAGKPEAAREALNRQQLRPEARKKTRCLDEASAVTWRVA